MALQHVALLHGQVHFLIQNQPKLSAQAALENLTGLPQSTAPVSDGKGPNRVYAFCSQDSSGGESGRS